MHSIPTHNVFFPDGTLSPDFPCYPNDLDSQGASVCCYNNQACLSSSMCVSLWEEPPTYNRGSCTDRDWNSTACPSFCADDQPGSGTRLLSCSGFDQWCCMANNTDVDCCDRKFSLKAGTTDTVIGKTYTDSQILTSKRTGTSTTRTSSHPVTSSPAATALNPVSATQASTSSRSSPHTVPLSSRTLASAVSAPSDATTSLQSSKPRRVIVIALATVLPSVIMLSLVSGIILYRRRRQKAVRSSAESVSPMMDSDGAPIPILKAELHADQSRHEMSAEQSRFEMSGERDQDEDQRRHLAEALSRNQEVWRRPLN